jgi:hypothetical protein
MESIFFVFSGLFGLASALCLFAAFMDAADGNIFGALAMGAMAAIIGYAGAECFDSAFAHACADRWRESHGATYIDGRCMVQTPAGLTDERFVVVPIQ